MDKERNYFMKSYIRLLIALLALPFLFVSPVLAKSAEEMKVVTLEKNVVVNHDYFAAGDSVVLSGTVNGDAYVAGGIVNVNGTVNGDLFVAGGQVHINGSVLHDLRAAGGTIIISTPVSGNVTVGGGNVTFLKDAKIGGSLLAGVGNLEILSPVSKSMTIGAGTLTIGNKVNGDVLAGVGTMSLLPDSKIIGNLTYWSKKDASLSEGATVSGAVLRHEPPAETTQELPVVTPEKMKVIGSAIASIFMVGKVIYFILTFIMGLILFAIVPVFTQNVVATFRKQPMAEFGIGLLSVIALPVIAVILCVTLVGLPVGIFMFAALGLLAFSAHIYAGLVLGDLMMKAIKANASRTVTYLAGLVALLILSFIPVLGHLATSVLQLIVLGALISEKYTLLRHMQNKKMI